MPNRYLPSALVKMIQEQREKIADNTGEEEYVPEWTALGTMLKSEHQEELADRREEKQ